MREDLPQWRGSRKPACRPHPAHIIFKPPFAPASASTSWTISLLPCTANLLQSDATLFVAASSPSLILQLTPVWLPSHCSTEITLSSLGHDLRTTRSTEPTAVLIFLCLSAAFDTVILLETVFLLASKMAPSPGSRLPLWSSFQYPLLALSPLPDLYWLASHSPLHLPCSGLMGSFTAPQTAQACFCLRAFAPSVLFAPAPPTLCIAGFRRTGILGSREVFLPN